jgi:hypothetical protein
MKSHNSKVIALSITGAVLLGALLFQNCAEVQFIGPGGLAKQIGLGQEGTERTLILRPTDRSVVPTVPMKVLLVIDDSASMAASQVKLQESMRSLLEPLKNYPVELKIISTSGLKQSSSIENHGWSYKVTGLGVRTPVSDAWKAKFNFQPDEVFSGGYDVYYHLNNSDRYEIAANDVDFESKLNALNQRILQISASSTGDDREQGLCNTLLALYDHGPHRFFHPGDKAAIVILSDEDDSSRWHTNDTYEVRRDCRNRYTYGKIGNPTLPQVVTADYGYHAWTIHFDVAFERENDGQYNPTTGGDNGGIRLKPAEAALVAGLSPSQTIPCEPRHIQESLNYSKSLFPVSKNRNHRITKCEIRATSTNLYSFGVADENRCGDSFYQGGTRYSSFEDYLTRAKEQILVAGSCSRSVSRTISQRNFSDFYIDGATDPEILNLTRTFPVAQHKASIQRALVNRAISLFGEDGFFISSIVHKDNQCLTSPAQSVGHGYISLGQGTAVADSIRSYSICSEVYNDAMADLVKQIRVVANNELILPVLLEGERVVEVVIIRDGERIPLSSDDFSLIEQAEDEQTIIRIVEERLQLGDSVEIILQRD